MSTLENWQPAKLPDSRTLHGRIIRLEKLTAASHADGLWQSLGPDAADPKLWDFLGAGPFTDRGAFDTYLVGLETSQAPDPWFYTVIDQATGATDGFLSLMSIVPEHGRIEIGNVTFGAAMQRTAKGTEAVYLLAREAFGALGNRRLEWKCDAGNGRSMRAARRFGFKGEGVFRQHMVVKGRSRDTAWFSIVDGEWPELRKAFEAWLEAGNFDGDGRQVKTLEELRKS